MTASAGPALKSLYGEFGDRVAFVNMYTREAHPGENYPQAKTFEQKLEQARDYKERDGIPWPVAVDGMEGELHRALDPKPHAAYIMDINGNVAFRTLWANYGRTLREGLSAISARPDATIGEREPKALPMTKGMGKFYETVSASGDVARRDLLREVPPMYALARLAALFHPLPPLGRGAAAMAVSAAGLFLLASGLRRALSR